METSRETTREKMEMQINQWGARLEGLRAKAKKAGADAGIELQRRVDDLHALQQSAKAHFERFVSASEEKWKITRTGLEASWTKITAAVEAVLRK